MARKLRNHGFVLPIILVYFFLSHIIYIGLLRYESVYQQKSKLYQQYYASSTQISMAKRLLLNNFQEQLGGLESQIMEQEKNYHQQLAMKLSNDLDQCQVDQMVCQLTDGNDDNVYIIDFEIQIPADLYEKLSENHTTLAEDFHIDNDVEWAVWKVHESGDIEDKLISDGYNLKDAFVQSFDWQWQPLSENQTFEFSHGSVVAIMDEVSQLYRIQSTVNQGDFNGSEQLRWPTYPIKFNYEIKYYHQFLPHYVIDDSQS